MLPRVARAKGPGQGNAKGSALVRTKKEFQLCQTLPGLPRAARPSGRLYRIYFGLNMRQFQLNYEILFFVESKISPDQHGFVKGKSCLSNLLETMDSVIELIEEGFPVGILFFDFKMAFDRVPHNRLILKLQCLQCL